MKAPAHDNWDAHWEHYAAAASRNPAQQMRHRWVTWLLQRNAPSGEQRVFDIGSGQGDLMVKLQRALPRAQFLGVERICLAGFPFFNLYRLMVIARGERLSSDVDATHHGAPPPSRMP